MSLLSDRPCLLSAQRRAFCPKRGIWEELSVGVVA